jgi:hypothetical protein
MGIYIFTKKETALKTAFAKNTVFPAVKELSKHSPNDGDISYIDVTGLTGTDLKKALTQLKKSCMDTPWGIVDPKGSIKDPAELFFTGASDYLGPDFFKKSGSIAPGRIKAASLWRKNAQGAIEGSGNKSSSKSANGKGSAGISASGIKFPPASAFPGWKKIKSGKALPFFLLYCSLKGEKNFDTHLGEKGIAQVHNRYLYHLGNILNESDGLLWMDSGKDSLFLLPPRINSVHTAVKACIRTIVSAPLVTLETLAVRIPVNFVFALHYGTINYKPPGRTGTVVSDAVNFIFHLGAKKSEPGRLTISSELPEGSIPKSLEDCFIFLGEFEDRKIWHTKKFSYIKPWL